MVPRQKSKRHGRRSGCQRNCVRYEQWKYFHSVDSALLSRDAPVMRTLDHTSEIDNGYPIIDRNYRWRFTITLDLSDRRHSNSDRAAPAQLYRGNLPDYHWAGRRVPPVTTPPRAKSTLRSCLWMMDD